MTIPAIQWHSVSYGVKKGFWMKLHPIVKQVDLSIGKGEALGIIGPNGAGKTTLIKLGIGLLHPDKGQVSINGIPAFQPEARKSIGLLTENQYVYPYLRLKEWLVMLGSLSGMPAGESNSKIGILLEQLGLSEHGKAYMRTLSKGQCQRAGIAQALLHNPDILLLDEPMSGLDPVWRRRIQDLLIKFQQNGGTLVFSSHILQDVFTLTDKIAMIRSGQIIWEGGIDALPTKDPKIQILFKTDTINDIVQIFFDADLKKLSEKTYMLLLPKGRQHIFWQMVAQKNIEVQSVNPVFNDQDPLFS